MFFNLKLLIGEWLFRIGYLAELTVIYCPTSKRGVYFGRTMREWERQEAALKHYRRIIYD